jgi:hypothetical protein
MMERFDGVRTARTFVLGTRFLESVADLEIERRRLIALGERL